MRHAKEGDTVRIHYTIKLDDGTIVGSTKNHEPFQFTIGDGQVIHNIEQAVVGMNPGECKTILLTAEEAFGPYQEEMVVVINRDRLPEGLNPKLGDQLQLNTQDGGTITVFVSDVSESTVTIDANHPLAGKDLTFDIEFLEVV